MFELVNSEITIGRAATNDFQILDPRLSGVHCKITKKFEDDKIQVELFDTSSNGTFHNGINVSKNTQ